MTHDDNSFRLIHGTSQAFLSGYGPDVSREAEVREASVRGKHKSWCLNKDEAKRELEAASEDQYLVR